MWAYILSSFSVPIVKVYLPIFISFINAGVVLPNLFLVFLGSVTVRVVLCAGLEKRLAANQVSVQLYSPAVSCSCISAGSLLFTIVKEGV